MIQPPRNLDPSRETKTMERLRKRMAEVKTLSQFEEIIRTGHEDHRGSLRKLLTPMLRPGLPCCGVAMLDKRCGRETIRHTRLCPSQNHVVLH